MEEDPESPSKLSLTEKVEFLNRKIVEMDNTQNEIVASANVIFGSFFKLIFSF
jgi:hypothetical protein